MKSACMKGRELERPGTGSLGEHHFQEKAWGRLPCQRPNCNMQRMNLSPPAGLVVLLSTMATTTSTRAHAGQHTRLNQTSTSKAADLQRLQRMVANTMPLFSNRSSALRQHRRV